MIRGTGPVVQALGSRGPMCVFKGLRRFGAFEGQSVVRRVRDSISHERGVRAESRGELVESRAEPGIRERGSSEAEFGHDPRLVKIPLDDATLTMSESLVYLKQRADLRVIRAFVAC